MLYKAGRLWHCLEMAVPAEQLVSCSREPAWMKDQQEKLYPSKVFGLPPTVVFILWYCRHRLLPLHCGRDLVFQRARPQQLHFPLGDSSGTKGKNRNVSITKYSWNQTCYIAKVKCLVVIFDPCFACMLDFLTFVFQHMMKRQMLEGKSQSYITWKYLKVRFRFFKS